MNQFKFGDSALVIGGDFLLGQHVEVRQWVSPGDRYHVDSQGVEYYLKSDAPSGGWAVTDGSDIGVKLDKNLMPLRGDFIPEQQKRLEVSAC